MRPAFDRGWQVPALTGIAAAAVTAIAIGVPAPWRDEQATAAAASRTVPQLIELVTGSSDAVNAAYFALMNLWVGLVGVDPFWMRLPSAVAVGVAAAGLVVLGRQLDRTRTGVIAAVLLVLIPRVFWAGGEARSSALQIAAAVWLTVLFVRVVRSGRSRSWIWFAVATAAANWLVLYLALVGVAQLLTLAIVPQWRARLLPAFAALWVAALATLPIAILAFGQREQISWLPRPGAATIGEVFQEQWFMGSTIFAVVAWVLVIGGIVMIARRDSKNATRQQILALLIPWLLLPTLLLIVVSLVGPFPLYLDRYLAMSAPAVAMLGAFGLSRLPPIAALAGLIVVAAAAAAPLIQLRAPDAKGDWGEIAALVETVAPQGDAVYFSADPFGDEPRGLMTFSPATFEGLYDIALKQSAADAGTLRDPVFTAAQVASALGDDDTLITVLADDQPGQEDRATFELLGLDETVIGDTGQTTVSLWRRG